MSNIPKEPADTLERAQEDFQGRIEQVHDRSHKLDREQLGRKILARVLKILTGLAGIVIAAGLLDVAKVDLFGQELTGSQLLGVGILAIVLVEGVFANFKRLVAVTAARDALERVGRQAENVYQDNYTEFLRIRDSKPVESAEGLLKLNKRVTKLLRSTIDKVESSLRVADAAAINTLNLEESKKTE